jgi:uncharacterized protein (TIGR00251 family)
VLDDLDYESTPDGIILAVQAQPGARRNGLVGIHAGRLKVAVTQVAEKGKANAAIIEALADGLRLKRSQVRLISGPTNPQKRLLISGVTEDDLRQRLIDALPAS